MSRVLHPESYSLVSYLFSSAHSKTERNYNDETINESPFAVG